MRYKILISLLALFFACKVTFIAGYDPIIEETVTKLQKDFNLHFIKFSRTIQDADPLNQAYKNFQDYYDEMNADIITLKSRSRFLDKKSVLIQKQINNLDSTFHAIENQHKKGFTDNIMDDRHDIRDAVNSSVEAVIKLQNELKPKK